MKHFFSLSLFLSLSFSCLFPLLSFAQTRFAAGPLSRSVHNERDAAIDRAYSWLIAQQNPVGYWGPKDAKLTAITVLAIAGDGLPLPPDSQKAIRHAISWLKSPSSTNSIPPSLSLEKSLSIRSWRDMALALFDPSSPPDLFPLPKISNPNTIYSVLEANVLRTQQSNQPLFSPSAISNFYNSICLTNDFVATSYLPAIPGSTLLRLANPIAKQFLLGARTMPFWTNAESAWWLAHTINHHLNGELIFLSHDEIFIPDWRSHLANQWITTQKLDNHGFGHWNESLHETIFALLLLKEL